MAENGLHLFRIFSPFKSLSSTLTLTTWVGIGIACRRHSLKSTSREGIAWFPLMKT